MGDAIHTAESQCCDGGNREEAVINDILSEMMD
jgi:hypothetical protein